MQVLVTGANGFVASDLIPKLLQQGYDLLCTTRHATSNSVAIGEISNSTDWSELLEGRSCVIHTAARVHVMNEQAEDPLTLFREVNVKGTLNLAKQAAAAGVKRFIFISSIKVNGEETVSGQSFTASDLPAPQDPYGVSKYEAEQALFQLSQETGMEVVMIRPPLVYGKGVKGNFASLIKLVNSGAPLPLASLKNQRAFVAVDNLTDLIMTCIDHPSAANEVFLVSDGVDLSTAELIKLIAKAQSKQARLFPCSIPFLTGVAKLLGKEAVAQRLFGNLQIDMSKTHDRLGWYPKVSCEDALKRALSN